MEANIKLVKSVVGSDISEPDVSKALSQCNNNADAAINLILDSPSSFSSLTNLTVQKTLTSTGGTRISTFKPNPGMILEEDEKKKSCGQLEDMDDDPLSVARAQLMKGWEEYKKKKYFDQLKDMKKEGSNEEDGGVGGFSEGTAEGVVPEKSESGLGLDSVKVNDECGVVSEENKVFGGETKSCGQLEDMDDDPLSVARAQLMKGWEEYKRKKYFDQLKDIKKEGSNEEDGGVGGFSEGTAEGVVPEKIESGLGLDSVKVNDECGVISEENKVFGGETKSCGQLEDMDDDPLSVARAQLMKGWEEYKRKKYFDQLKDIKKEGSNEEDGGLGGFSEGTAEGVVPEKSESGLGLDSVKVNDECGVVSEENKVFGGETKSLIGMKTGGSVGRSNLGFEEWLSLQENGKSSEKEEMKSDTNNNIPTQTKVKEEPCDMTVDTGVILVKEEVEELIDVKPLTARKLSDDEYRRIQNGGNNSIEQKKVKREDMKVSALVIEDGDFPEDPDWLLVGRTVITGLSTTKGRKLENNEIVHFIFPNLEKINKTSAHFMSFRAANAASTIVRFSTKRSGEIGRLPMDWAKCLVPLVNSSKVKVLGRCVAAPLVLQLMQEIMLYVSFYIHHSVFTEGETSSWKLEQTNIDTTIYPLLTLFKMLKVNPFQRAEFSPEELDSRKRSLKLNDDSEFGDASLPLMKKRKGCQLQEKNNDEICITESSLNKLVGAADVYNLEEMKPPETLTCDLRPYQKQALYWMSELEKGASTEEAGKTLHPCWAAYRVCDERAPAIYVNIFSGEATTKFPTATQVARGGILADAMGLGKTVMTIALILARRGRGSPEGQQVIIEDESRNEYIKNKKKDSKTKALHKVKGGTLIICPMALLGQWKDELETHSKPDSISVSVYYGGGRANDPKIIAEPDVVLTTYGVLQSAYKTDSVNSIFHGVEWHRVVLDEAHTIKSSKTQAAQAAFALSAYSRWCLTGTPLQNNLEDLYSLLCFLKVEPWCNWAWWNKMIQRPYENNDQRGLKLVKAILRPLMLRRTKESKDKEGRPILVLPPTDVQTIECEQSEAEHDFYNALFKRSKVQFDQFVAQGKVLHNYANILELLLRLRQCCNHPFLVMSRRDSDEHVDLNKLARRFLQPNSDSSTQTGPSRAYVEEVVEGLRNGENAECPICLESSDDPVLTPCAHRMCRECLLSSWRSPAGGLCPICRQMLKKTELITCPSGGRFKLDVEKNWKESSKISKLLDCLTHLRKSGSGEKSIVFSQWTSFLDLLEIPLKRRNIGFLRFDGRLSQKQRERVLHEFSETKEKMILLMSLRAGGVGLNLTAASNVFLMDPWWNPAVEEQAIMRIHRIGQKRTVCVRRFIVKDTVEERLQQVQARKQRMIAGALTDEEVRSARIEELKMLFR